MKKTVFSLMILLVIAQLPAIFGKNKIQVEPISWSVIKTLHFDIYYEKGNDEFGKTAALLAEDAYYYLKKDFKVPIKTRIPLIFYSTNYEFESTNIIPMLLSEGVGGFTETQHNRVAIPFNGSYLKMEETLIHELTHAYINDINNTHNTLVRSSGLPFWFSEGLPEYLAIGGEKVDNNVYVIDLLFNDTIPEINMIGGFYAYRLGELFLAYLAEEYGREKVMDLFYALRFTKVPELAIKRVFDLEFDELQKRWRNYLKRKYSIYLQEFDVPYEVFEQLTFHEKDGSNMNFPVYFIPGTRDYLYFSDMKIHTDIWKNSILEPQKPTRIIKGETSGKIEEFHLMKNNLAFFPDNDKFAFAAKTSAGDLIQVASVKNKKIVETITIPEIETIYEIDINLAGDKIAFSGQRDFQCDIYVYDLNDRSLQQITDDRYYDSDPKWDNSGTRLAFCSERQTNRESVENHLFYQLSEDIFYYDFSNNVFYQVTDDSENNSAPIWDNKGENIIFVGENEVTVNLETINLETGKRAKITKCLGSVISGDLNEDNDELIFSCFYDRGWDIFLISNPLENLEYEDYQQPAAVSFEDDFSEKFSLSEYELFGERERTFRKELPELRKNVSKMEIGDIIKQDSLDRKYNYELDKKPTDVKKPTISDYKTRFFLDNLWGGMAYSPTGGTFAQIQFSMSDLMGDKAFGVNLGISGSLENSNIILSYLYLANRIDYGVAGLYLNNSFVARFIKDTSVYGYLRERQKEYGVMGTLRYPFNKFWRLDFDAMLYRHELHYDWTYDLNNKWEKDFIDPDVKNEYDLEPYEKSVLRPQFTINFDNAIYGLTGPMSGWKSALILQHNLTTMEDHSLVYFDIRKYHFFNKRYAFAFRLLGGQIFGDTDTRFDLDYYNGVRGFYDDELLGTKKVVANAEIRFPFIDNLSVAFPLPIYMGNIRGSAFVDVGTVWDDSMLKLYDTGRFEDLKVGFGFGPRINLGYFVLKFDIAWNTNLGEFSRPSYYLSLSPDF
ncbi:MAG: BamA/TamA family outer membrane protein [Candidatus Cloacimonetes bacterium]|nr:BamA/TamA family outer membrane protein [Candidatus Cloacimonadota bacterium]